MARRSALARLNEAGEPVDDEPDGFGARDPLVRDVAVNKTEHTAVQPNDHVNGIVGTIRFRIRVGRRLFQRHVALSPWPRREINTSIDQLP